MTLIRRALTNTFRIRFRLGLFDPVEKQRWSHIGAADVNNAEAKALNRAAARQSLVLLQNNQSTTGSSVLPFAKPTCHHLSDGKAKKIVVVGGSANSTTLLAGSYARPLAAGEHYPAIPQAI